MDSSTFNQVGFHAMPDSPHLTWSACGYTLLTLAGLAPDISTGQIARLTLNGVDHRWRPMGDTTLMVIPAFKQEAQRVVLHLTPTPVVEATKPFKKILAEVAPPNLSMGFTPPHNRYRRHPDDTQ